jgi:hypothetical protein
MKNSVLSFSILLLGICFVSFASNTTSEPVPKSMKITIDHYPSYYEGEGRHLCLRAKSEEKPKWHSMDFIEGFNYEWGYVYELSVKKTQIKNPPADGSSVKYTLVKEISKTKVADSITFNLRIEPGNENFGLVPMITKINEETSRYMDVVNFECNRYCEAIEESLQTGKKSVLVTCKHIDPQTIELVDLN